MAEFTPQQVAAWLRKQAEELNGMADRIEQTLRLVDAVRQAQGGSQLDPDVVQRAKVILSQGSLRRGELQQRLRVSMDEVDALLKLEGFENHGGRGWYRYTGSSSQELGFVQSGGAE